MKMVLASKNAHKLGRNVGYPSCPGVEVVRIRRRGVDVDVEETGTTFEEKRLAQGQGGDGGPGLPSIADDSGLMVDALNGCAGSLLRPLRRSGLDDVGRYRLLLDNMRGQLDRRCRFVSAICCFPNGDIVTARGSARYPGLRPQGGGRLWVRPRLLRPSLKKTFAELTGGEKKRRLSPGRGPWRPFREPDKLFGEPVGP